MTSSRRQLVAAALAVALVSSPGVGEYGVARAQAAATSPALTPDQARAAEHFQRAKDLYQAGSYRDAIPELEAARALDPKAKELVFNLGIVHEKLGRFDEAIGWFETYMGMEGVSAAERAKAESVIKRIEGAKREAAQAEPTGPGPAPAPPPGPEPVASAPAHGRIDGLTIGAASLAGLSLGVGTIFGIRALAQRPNDFVTGRDGSYADLRDDTDAAHTSAVIADVGFAVGAVAAAATALLYFGRTKDAPRPEPAPMTARVTAARLDGGAAVGLAGTF